MLLRRRKRQAHLSKLARDGVAGLVGHEAFDRSGLHDQCQVERAVIDIAGQVPKDMEFACAQTKGQAVKTLPTQPVTFTVALRVSITSCADSTSDCQSIAE